MPEVEEKEVQDFWKELREKLHNHGYRPGMWSRTENDLYICLMYLVPEDIGNVDEMRGILEPRTSKVVDVRGRRRSKVATRGKTKDGATCLTSASESHSRYLQT